MLSMSSFTIQAGGTVLVRCSITFHNASHVRHAQTFCSPRTQHQKSGASLPEGREARSTPCLANVQTYIAKEPGSKCVMPKQAEYRPTIERINGAEQSVAEFTKNVSQRTGNATPPCSFPSTKERRRPRPVLSPQAPRHSSRAPSQHHSFTPEAPSGCCFILLP